MQAENRSTTPHPKFRHLSLSVHVPVPWGVALGLWEGEGIGAEEKADKPTASTTRTAQLRGNQSACGFSFVVPRPTVDGGDWADMVGDDRRLMPKSEKTGL